MGKSFRAHVYLPQGLDIPSVFSGYDDRWIDFCSYLIGTTYRHTHYSDLACNSGYANLKTEYLRLVIPQRKLAAVRDALVVSGLLEMDHRYVPGEHSMGYRLPRYWRKSRPVKVHMRTDFVSRNILRLKGRHMKSLSDVHRHMRAMFDLVDFNASEMMRIIDKHGSNEMFTPTLYLAAKELGDNDWVPTVCDYGRFHTPLTRLLEDCRAAIRIRGSRVSCLDIANSQPLFLGKILYDACDFHTPNAHRIGVADAPPDTRGSVNDFSSYILDVQNGVLYDKLMPGVKRDAAKKRLFRDVFYGPLTTYETRPAKVFKGMYPNVYAAILREKIGDHRRLAWKMQRTESDFMVGVVCRRIMSEYPQEPFLTIHDSVICHPSVEDSFHGLMMDEFRKIGLNPTIRRKPI